MRSLERPSTDEYAAFYRAYVDQVPNGEILDLLVRQGEETARLLATVDEKHAQFRYASGKWSVKEIVGHLTDSERVFSYRALVAARGDRTPLPGFDENDYVAAAGFDRRSLSELAGELADVRRATLSLFGGFSVDQGKSRGIANGSEVSVRALAWIIAGHERHHVRVLGERYDVTLG